MTDWQPIGTAPKDGSHLIVALTGDREPVVGEAYWHVIEHQWYWANMGPQRGWDDPITEMCHNPITHWQPLPAPPQETQG